MGTKGVLLFMLLMGKIASLRSCEEIRETKMLTYSTPKQALFSEGSFLQPCIIDLIETYSICGVRYKSDTLAALFRTANEKESQGNTEIKLALSKSKRAAPLVIAGGVAIASSIWAGISYSRVNGRIDELRQQERHDTAYTRKIMLELDHRQHLEFVAIRREFNHVTKNTRDQICKATENLTRTIIESKFEDEFDDLMNSLKTHAVTAKILPPPILYNLVATLPQLHDTIYVKSPYLIYHTGKFSFNLQEVGAGGDILRGVLELPLIKTVQDIEMKILIKNVGNELLVFNPVYVTAHTMLSVEKCKNEINTYYCTDSDLVPVKMTPLKSSSHYKDGLVILNDKEVGSVKIKTKGNALQTITGPAICTSEDTSSVIINNKVIFTSSYAFHFKLKQIVWDVEKLPITLETSSQDSELGIGLSHPKESIYNTLHGLHVFSTIILAVVIIVFTWRAIIKFRKHSAILKTNKENKLQEIIVLTEASAGSEKVRTLQKQ